MATSAPTCFKHLREQYHIGGCSWYAGEEEPRQARGRNLRSSRKAKCEVLHEGWSNGGSQGARNSSQKRLRGPLVDLLHQESALYPWWPEGGQQCESRDCSSPFSETHQDTGSAWGSPAQDRHCNIAAGPMEAPEVVGAGAHEVGQEAESGVCSAQRGEGKEETLLWSAAAQWDKEWRWSQAALGGTTMGWEAQNATREIPTGY